MYKYILWNISVTSKQKENNRNNVFVCMCEYLFFPFSEVRSLKTFQLRNSKLGSRKPSFCKMADVGLWVGLISLQDGTKWHRTMQRDADRLTAILRYESLSSAEVKD